MRAANAQRGVCGVRTRAPRRRSCRHCALSRYSYSRTMYLLRTVGKPYQTGWTARPLPTLDH